MKRLLAVAMLLLLATGSAAEPQKRTDEHEKSADAGDKMICKRFLETGSLVRGYRACKTKRDWERERDNLRTVNNSNSCATLGTTGVCN